MANYGELSIQEHRKHQGKWEVRCKFELKDRHDLSIAYTPGVGAVCEVIHKDPAEAYPLTMKGNSVAIVSDGSAVLGLGDLGPLGGLPVMEGKAILFKEFAGINGVPLMLDTKDTAEIIRTVKLVAPTFGGINLEDISAPRCFEIEDALQDIGIPVFHDDQHGTAIVLLAALMNACKLTGKPIEEMKVVINGAGAAGTAIARLLRCISQNPKVCVSVKDVLMCDTKGIISRDRKDLNEAKLDLLRYTNHSNVSGSLEDALKGADVFVGVSKGNLLNGDHIRSMAKDPIIFAMANPIPEIMPDEAYAAGAAVVGTGRSDFPNQVNNVLAFPGIFRGALDAKASRITPGMKLAAAKALANAAGELGPKHILPDSLDREVARIVANAVKEAWEKEQAISQ